jgi:hypothetical protein
MLEAESRWPGPSAVCDAISVVAEFMVRVQVTGLPSAVCGVISVVTEFMVRVQVTGLPSAVCDVISVVTEFRVSRWIKCRVPHTFLHLYSFEASTPAIS